MVAVRFLPPTPPWLQKLLKKDFYNEENKCRIHKSQYETFFCKDCMSDFFCQICAKDIINRDHQNHTIVKVFTCSRQASVNIVEFEEIWSIKDIQPYRINGKMVVYLRTDKQGITSPDNGCRTCQRRLLDHETYKYCSIKCQIKSDKYRNGGRVESNEIEVNDDVVPVPVPAATESPPWRREDQAAVLILNESKQQAAAAAAANAGLAKAKKRRRRWSQSQSQWQIPKRKRNDQKRRRTDEPPPPPVTVINGVTAMTVNIGAMVVVPPVKKSRRKQLTPHRAPLK